MKTPAFEHEGLIPIEYTGYGADISPELNLQNLAENGIFSFVSKANDIQGIKIFLKMTPPPV